MISINYNYNLFIILFAGLLALNGAVWCIFSVVNDGEPRKWRWYGMFDGILNIAVAVIPLFF